MATFIRTTNLKHENQQLNEIVDDEQVEGNLHYEEDSESSGTETDLSDIEEN